ncbi:MAG: hydroxyacid dehydrogenase [Marinosulfonomonas sp.]
MPNVLVAGKLHPAGLAVLEDAPNVTVDYVEDTSSEAMLPYLPNAEAIILRMQDMSADTVALSPKLKLVSRHGVGYDMVDVAALNARKIGLTITGDVNSRTVAEHTMMLLLSASHRTPSYDAAARSKQDWGFRNSMSAREISGKTLLIVGFGRIGRILSQMAQGFDIKILAFDPFIHEQAGMPEGVTLVPSLHDGLRQADIVSLHMPKLDSGYVLGEAELACLPPHGIVINAARGGLIDEDALVAALSNGTLHSAGLDVFEQEPPNTQDPLFQSNKVVLTPHSASMTVECAERMAVKAARNVLDYFDATIDPALIVNADSI